MGQNKVAVDFAEAAWRSTEKVILGYKADQALKNKVMAFAKAMRVYRNYANSSQSDEAVVYNSKGQFDFLHLIDVVDRESRRIEKFSLPQSDPVLKDALAYKQRGMKIVSGIKDTSPLAAMQLNTSLQCFWTGILGFQDHAEAFAGVIKQAHDWQVDVLELYDDGKFKRGDLSDADDICRLRASYFVQMVSNSKALDFMACNVIRTMEAIDKQYREISLLGKTGAKGSETPVPAVH